MEIIVRNYKLILNFCIIIGLVVSPLILFFINVSTVENNPSVCLSVVFFNQECYGCGMGRALFNLFHLNFKEAYYYNSLSFVVFPLLLFTWIKEVLNRIKIIKKHHNKTI